VSNNSNRYSYLYLITRIFHLSRATSRFRNDALVIHTHTHIYIIYIYSYIYIICYIYIYKPILSDFKDKLKYFWRSYFQSKRNAITSFSYISLISFISLDIIHVLRNFVITQKHNSLQYLYNNVEFLYIRKHIDNLHVWTSSSYVNLYVLIAYVYVIRYINVFCALSPYVTWQQKEAREITDTSIFSR